MSVEHPQESKSRLGGYSAVYCDISEKEFSRSVELEALWGKEEDPIIKTNLEDQYLVAGVKTIIFAALSMEAAINDYGAWQLGDKYFDHHLSSLDVVSKWIVTPKLVCGKSFDKSGPTYSALKQLIRARNDLVHNKSRHLNISDSSLHEKLEKRSRDFDANIINAYRCVVLLSLTMDKLVSPKYNPLKSFNKSINPLLETPQNILDVVNECRSIIANIYS